MIEIARGDTRHDRDQRHRHAWQEALERQNGDDHQQRNGERRPIDLGGFAHHQRTELHGRKTGQRTLKFPNRRTHSGDNDYVFHFHDG